MSDATERLLENVKSAVMAKAVRRLEPIQRIEQALAAYRRAVEGQVASEYARDHSLPSPGLSGDPVATASALQAAVTALPELSGASSGPRSAPQPVAPAPPVSVAVEKLARAEAPTTQLPVEWGPLLRRVLSAPVVIVGGVVRSERLEFAPREVMERVEWVDTTRQGTHAIGNLPQRIKAGRVAALVMMEGLIGHRHSEPLVHVAREVGLPLEFAGKGGRAALARAFISINQKLDALESA